MKSILNWAWILMSLILLACSEENIVNNDDDDGIKISDLYVVGEVSIANNTVKMYSDQQELTTGYNTLYFTVQDADETYIDDAILNVKVLMNMTNMSHSCPNEAIVNLDDAHLYSKDVVFVMPSNSDELWEVTISLDGIDTEASLEFEVGESSMIQKFMQDGKMYFVSLVHFNQPTTGMNDIEFTVHSKESMMSWPAEELLSIEMTPYMPGMGHGSPNNENPIHGVNGHYHGKVNFTMTGDWTITLDISDEQNTLGSVVFPITF